MKGRPFLGVISGFLFGALLGITLFLFGVLPLDSDWLWILPLLGTVLGLVMAAWAPFGGGDGQTATEASTTATAASGTTLEQEAVPPLDEGGPATPSDVTEPPPPAGGDEQS